MKNRDVMTQSPVCCVASDSVNKAAQLMSIENVGAIPVVDSEQNKKLVGIVTDRDLTLKIVAENRSPRDTRIEDVMTRNLVTCAPDDDLSKTIEVMSQHQIRRVPVVGTRGEIVGIIAQADVALQNNNEQKTAQLVEEISRP